MTQTCALLDSLGFTILPVKSIFIPIQSIEFLGFQLDSQKMLDLVSLTNAKATKIRTRCAELSGKQTCSIRHLAQVVGHLVAAHPGVWIAPVIFKRLEIAEFGNFYANV